MYWQVVLRLTRIMDGRWGFESLHGGHLKMKMLHKILIVLGIFLITPPILVIPGTFGFVCSCLIGGIDGIVLAHLFRIPTIQ